MTITIKIWKESKDSEPTILQIIDNIYVCVCVCVCVWERERERERLHNRDI